MNKRYQQGIKKLEEILGDKGASVVDAISNMSPDFARLYVEVPFTDIYSRGVLENKTRELLAIAALTCIGDVAPQLETHIYGALNVGCTRDEIMEAIIQMSVFAGFPRTIKGLTVAHNIFSKL
jgi:4-carboxymuconolactone decarboxylase